MKKIALSALPLFFLLVFSSSCRHEEDDIEIPTAVNYLIVTLIQQLQNNELTYDSVYITFSNSGELKRQKLDLERSRGFINASGIVRNLAPGNYKTSITYYKTLVSNSKSEVKVGSVNLTITPTSKYLFSDGTKMSIVGNKQHTPVEKIISWNNNFAFYLSGTNKSRTVVTLPADPLDPFFEISIASPDWGYFYADRVFYNSPADEPGSHYLQGSAALEAYNENNKGVDYIDTLSFKLVTSEVRNRAWNIAECLVTLYVGGQEQILYYTWDFRNLDGGRKGRAGIPFAIEQMEARKTD